MHATRQTLVTVFSKMSPPPVRFEGSEICVPSVTIVTEQIDVDLRVILEHEPTRHASFSFVFHLFICSKS